MFYDILSNPASRERLRASSIVNQPWPRLSARKRRAMVDLLSSLYRLWPQWVLGDPPCHWYDRGRQFRGVVVVAAWPSDATHAVAIFLFTAIGIALDDSDGGDEATTY